MRYFTSLIYFFIFQFTFSQNLAKPVLKRYHIDSSNTYYKIEQDSLKKTIVFSKPSRFGFIPNNKLVEESVLIPELKRFYIIPKNE
jgi:hypothetical protein